MHQREDWFVHERMSHKDGGIENRPPEENAHGEETGALDDRPAFVDCVSFLTPAGDFCHPRSWDIHFWRGADGVATVSILSPRPIPGLNVDQQFADAFFYPCDDVRNVKQRDGHYYCR